MLNLSFVWRLRFVFRFTNLNLMATSASAKLAAHIRRLGITQAEAAIQLGVSGSVLHYWLQGAVPRAHYLATIERWSGGKLSAGLWLREREAS